MPADSDVTLPHTFRPLGVRLAIFVLGGLLVLVVAVMWLALPAEIRAQFDEARDLGYDAIAHDCLQIADDGRRDYQVSEDGREAVDHDHIQRSKLRIETRLKLLARWDPRRYGEKVQLANHEGGELPAPQFIVQPVAVKADE